MIIRNHLAEDKDRRKRISERVDYTSEMFRNINKSQSPCHENTNNPSDNPVHKVTGQQQWFFGPSFLKTMVNRK